MSSPPKTEMISIEIDGRVVWVSLDRPEAANARNQQMRNELADTWRWVAGDGDIGVVVLTGAGERHFCAGMDLKEAKGEESPVERRERMRSQRDIELLAALPQPTIAAVNGAALGGGFEMALACDLRVVADEAKVGLPEVTHGLMPGGGATVRLPRLVGAEAAMEFMLLGTVLTGAEAVAAGLARRNVPRSELRETVAAMAERIAGFAGAATRAIKEAVRFGFDNPSQVALDRELDGLLWLLARGDSKGTA